MDPLAIDARMLIQMGAVLASLSGAYVLVRTQVRGLLKSRDEMKENFNEIYNKLDKVESAEAVKSNQLKTISKILSPDNLEKRNREMGGITSELARINKRLDLVEHMHNSTHPAP
tara:strand:+ start:116 stop:460 length:345 start_codon:yes stop_codon:yes gene_type:complete